jgi:phosphopantothenoylcysteine decarboxylase/phosphopantothenate--cysteine ligase
VVIAPATANIIGKLAHGIADNLATSVLMATRKPLLIAPAMNTAMWENQVVQKNIRLLRELGVKFVGPETGEMGGVNEPAGMGRMSEPEDILSAIEALVSDRTRWAGKRVLVTSGPTREAIDPVRFISNRSSGRMGDAIARQAYLRGAEVTLVRGMSAEEKPPAGPVAVEVETAAEMAQAVKERFEKQDLLIMAAAVADWTSEKVSESKLKKKDGLPRIPWRKTEDILEWAGRNKKQQVVVGFALETTDHLKEAKRKLTAKKADLIALNDATKPQSAFGGDSIQLTIVPREGETVELLVLSKYEAAGQLLDRIEPLLGIGNG